MEINSNRLKENILKIGEIGKKGKGITRLAYSKEYFEARERLKDLMLEQGLEVSVDKVGNIFGRREGIRKLPAIMIGSHLDTVKNGGIFDGNLGVIAALECVSALNDNDIETNHPIEIVAFIAEEGSEMGGTFGSRVIMGRQDMNDKTLPEKLANYHMTVKDIEDSIRVVNDIKAFIELHIEQGGILDNKKIPIGVVSGIVGITRYIINVKGEANHAGTTPMDLRKDALVATSKLILEIDIISKSMGNPFVSTIGTMKVYPGSVNVIPGEVEMILEMRDIDQEKIDYFLKKIKEYTKEIEGFEFKFTYQIEKPPVKTTESIMDYIKEVCNEREINYLVMASGAGHDAKEIANKLPTGMIFVPSKNGMSHCPEEYTEWEDVALGTKVLLETILKIDKEI